MGTSIKFVARRAISAVAIVLGVSLLSFLLIHLIPGDPVRIALGPFASDSAVEKLRETLGYNDPLYLQYFNFLRNASMGSFGYSIKHHTTVAELIGPRILVTVTLLLMTTTLTIVLAVPLAIIAALHENKIADHVLRLITTVALSMPSFWLALVLVEVFAVRLNFFPVAGYEGTLIEKVGYLLLPSTTLALALAPVVARTLRANIIATLGSDYIEAAKCRGLHRGRIIWRHVLPNASSASVTILAVNLGFLIGGTVVIEMIFNLPGLGSLMQSAVSTRDYAVVQASTVLFAAMVVIVGLIADIAHVAMDPRVRIGR